MKTVAELKKGDYIAFGFNYHGGEPDEIMVSNISLKRGDDFLTHFLYGHHSLAEYIKPENILAIGNMQGETKLKGWSGKFDLVNPTPLILKDVENLTPIKNG